MKEMQLQGAGWEQGVKEPEHFLLQRKSEVSGSA